MELESLFSESKWKILAELSISPLSPKELAKKTNTSMANMSTQIRLLEAMDFIEKQVIGKNPNRARKLYRLKKEFCYMTLATKTTSGKKLISSDDSMFFFKVFLINEKSLPHALIRLYCENEPLFSRSCFGYVSIKGNDVEILLLDDEMQKPQDKISWKGNDYNLKYHLFSKKEFEEKIRQGDEHALSLLRRVFILIDDGMLARLKRS
ncbi:MAG: winged helix-turn-helix domain-containing protein [Candidatus Woesearchaeota archaeon]|nr:winged helix-turn-helix domain-containing protein [Candidatus Woesearchaeota archaeon]